MQLQFLLGPAGSGKTFRILADIRNELVKAPDGPPLLLIAPKQTTYQLEQQFLAEASVAGYTRLHILSFERLAGFIFDQLRRPAPRLLDEEGRVMVLRGLLARKREDLKLFRASARLTGFAQQLNLVLRELQSNQLAPESLLQLANSLAASEGLSLKLRDLATMLRDYLNWLEQHQLQDADCRLSKAAEALQLSRSAPAEAGATRFTVGQLWVDGFAELSEQELELLGQLFAHCNGATMTFCLDGLPKKSSWLSTWSLTRKTFEDCRRKFAALAGVETRIEVLPRHPDRGRFFNNPVLQHLERHWSAPEPFEQDATADFFAPTLDSSLRVATCADAEREAVLAAREIIRFTRRGGRYREATVLVRKLDAYHQVLQRVFSRYAIPYFLDRREMVSHHPLAELTRSALRTVAHTWQPEDWFAVLKTGLTPASEQAVDQLENEALARGWRGTMWHQPVRIRDKPRTAQEKERLEQLEAELERIRQQAVPPFDRFELTLRTVQNKPTGPQLAAAVRDLWQVLNVETRLEAWADAELLGRETRAPGSVHETVWTQMNTWLSNVELAFPNEALPLREWLPILEAGLSNLSVGVVPPALDQVLVGSIERSRNPEIRLAIVLGLNEGVFPSLPQPPVLLTETDRLELEQRSVRLGGTSRHHLARERYYAYIACTRARERLVLTSAAQDGEGAPLNPSPFLSQIRHVFPGLQFEDTPAATDWRDSEHAVELIAPLLRASNVPQETDDTSSSLIQPPIDFGFDAAALGQLPALAGVLEQVRGFHDPKLKEPLPPKLAEELYGPVLRTSVSRMENFAACPFRFFVHSGLRAEERKRFELDVKEQGTFQHEALSAFHEQLKGAAKRWRDITPAEARDLMERIARGLVSSYRDGLLQASEETRFMARVLTHSLQDFVETLVGWMREQYQFDPVSVELGFGEADGPAAWVVPLAEGRRLELNGRIDRVDLCRSEDGESALCVVVDYKSGSKKLDPVLLEHGLQLQLLGYLKVLQHWPELQATFGISRLVPAGVFYVSLRGKYPREANRLDALAGTDEARKGAYRHTGRFDFSALPFLDGRSAVDKGDQFNYRLTKEGQLHKNSKEGLGTSEFRALLDSVEEHLRRMGEEIYAGVTTVDPYRKGTQAACTFCGYKAICRIDPWTHRYRVLRNGRSQSLPAASQVQEEGDRG